MAYKNPHDPRIVDVNRRYYLRTKESFKERRTQSRIAARAKCRSVIIELKSVPCTDCGVQYPFYVMEFDHLDASQKVNDISRLSNAGSLRAMLEEIKKCEVVCANCHRVRTYTRGH